MAASALLTPYCLRHGSAMRVMVAYAAINVPALFVRPAIADWIIARKPLQWANPPYCNGSADVRAVVQQLLATACVAEVLSFATAPSTLVLSHVPLSQKSVAQC